jgi:hypothetical protein
VNQAEQRDQLVKVIDTRLRYASSVAERQASLATIRELLAVPSTIRLEEEITMPLTWAEVHKMAETGWVSFGAHTMYHPILARLTDPAEVQREVGECRRVLEEQLGHSVCTFSYPIGKPGDVGDEALRAVQEAGYNWAVTTVNGTNTPQSDPYQLRRVLGDVSRHRLVMAAEVSGLWHFLFHRRKKL